MGSPCLPQATQDTLRAAFLCLRTMDQPLPFGCKCCRLLPTHHLRPVLPFLLTPNRLSTSTVFVSTSVAAAVVGFLRAKGQALGVTGAASHLVGRIPFFSIQPNLLYDVAQVGKIWGGVWEGREGKCTEGVVRECGGSSAVRGSQYALSSACLVAPFTTSPLTLP